MQLSYKINTSWFRYSFASCFLFCFLLFGEGCNNVESADKKVEQGIFKYFDLKGFLDAETERLLSKPSFTKTVFVNGEQETKSFNELDLKTELMPFSNSDINKPAWSDKYDIDSIFNQKKELIGLRYQTEDKKLKTKKVDIDFEKNNVEKIVIENTTKSSVANTYQTLVYRPKEGYSIESKQDVSLMEETLFRIEVSFK